MAFRLKILWILCLLWWVFQFCYCQTFIPFNSHIKGIVSRWAYDNSLIQITSGSFKTKPQILKTWTKSTLNNFIYCASFINSNNNDIIGFLSNNQIIIYALNGTTQNLTGFLNNYFNNDVFFINEVHNEPATYLQL